MSFTLTPMMMMGLIVLMSMFYAAGNILLKQAVAAGQPTALAGAYIALMSGNLFYLWLIFANGLGVASALSSLASMIAAMLAARFLFGEVFNAQQIAGMVLAVISVALVSLPPFFGR